MEFIPARQSRTQAKTAEAPSYISPARARGREEKGKDGENLKAL